MSKKEAEKQEKQKKECTFKPDRIKTKKLDSVLTKSHNKENEENQFERLYRVSKE